MVTTTIAKTSQVRRRFKEAEEDKRLRTVSWYVKLKLGVSKNRGKTPKMDGL